MITSDFHMHTELSGDCKSPVRAMADAAVQKGLSTICITDHEDYDWPMMSVVELRMENPEEYVHTIHGFQEEYKGKLDIRLGIEIGLRHHAAEYYHDLIQKYPFDFVIGSLHYVDGEDPYLGYIFDYMSDEDAYRRAFVNTYECIDIIPDFDVLGHMDYTVRYGKTKAEKYSYANYKEEIDEILRRLVEKGKGLEINTSGLKYGLGFCHPHPDVLKRYRELGGEIVTVGSDAHLPEYVAYEFKTARDVLLECGFKYYTEYKNRKPFFRQLQ